MYVLDASVIAKWFLPEADSNLAIKFKEGFVNGEFILACPDLLLYELANLLRYNSSVTDKDLEELLRLIFALDLFIVTPRLELLIKAGALARRFGISTYDAVYLGLAEELGFFFVTADRKLHSKVDKLDFVKLLQE